MIFDKNVKTKTDSGGWYFSSEVESTEYSMGFWSGKEEFDSQEKIRVDEDFTVEASGSGSEVDSVENNVMIKGGSDIKQDLDEWEKFWKNSQNYVVYTKTKTSNPNDHKEAETQPWDGYCL